MSLRLGSDERWESWKEVVGRKKRERDFLSSENGKVWQRSYNAFRSIPTTVCSGSDQNRGPDFLGLQRLRSANLTLQNSISIG